DLDALARLNADARFMRHLGPPMAREDTWRQLAMLLGHWQLRGYGMWALELKESGAFIGRLGLHYPEGWPGLEVGFALDPNHWGQGLATEGGRAALDVAFAELGAGRVVSVIHPENAASIRVAEKLGLSFDHRRELRGVEVNVYAIEATARPPSELTASPG
ncbi:MAG: GNAT family N-acetyltransferase, partial [Geminicoccales bacterium]